VVLLATTVDLLVGSALQRLDLRISAVVGAWHLRSGWSYPPLWLVSQLGGRVALLGVLAALSGYLAWRSRTLLPASRVVVALVLLTAAVYAVKYGTGRTAPAYPGSFFHRQGESFPSGHVANAVLMWGLARWQAVEYDLPPRWQRLFRALSLTAPVATGLVMVALNFHWASDVVAGAALGVLLLGVLHGLDAVGLSRWARARSGRTTHPGSGAA
jgi:membrane-associated phospholipid phosphatase